MENKGNIKNIIKSIFYSLSSNFFVMLASAVITLFVPRFMGVEEFAYWQLYLFYSSYSGYFHFGWIDGFLLRNSGSDSESIDRQDVRTQLVLQTFVMAVIAYTVWYFLNTQDGTKDIVLGFCINIVLVNLRYYLICVCQSISKFKEMAVINISDRVIFLLFLLAEFLFGRFESRDMILADILAKTVSIFIAGYLLKEILIGRLGNLKREINQITANIAVGIKLMVSSLTSMLSLGIVRFKVEACWDLIVFGKISLCISIVNLFITFVNAVGIIFFQVMYRIPPSSHEEYYKILRKSLSILIVIILGLYFPTYYILLKWIPQYTESLIYMGFLFPMCLFESKMVLLDSAFLKIYRRENELLAVNILSVVLGICFYKFSIDYLKSIEITLLFIVMISFLKCCFAEKIIRRKIGIHFKFSIEEIFFSCLFIIMATAMDKFAGGIIYFVVLIFYLALNRKGIHSIYLHIKNDNS